MPRKPKIKLKDLKKSGLLKEEVFYQKLSAENNFVETKIVKDFYLSLMRVISRDLLKYGIIRLPHMGHFALVKQKDRIGLAGKYRKMIRNKYVLKFYPMEIWRKYFTRRIKERSGLEAKLDPREKILGQDLDFSK